jgi:Ni,Fe-hydrogenase I large subunit
MQSLTKEFKKTWYRFEKQNLDHDYIFKKYCEHLLDLIKNLINRHFHHAQLFSNAKQKKKQSMQAFDVFLNNLENQLISYIEKQRIIHLFIKLWSKLRAALTNYQNLFIIKKELLILTNRLKNNMKKTIDAQTTFDSRSSDFKTSQHKNRKKDEKRNNKNSFNDKLKTRNRRKNIDEKKWKRANYFYLICHKCNEVEHIVTNCFDLKKKFKINVIFNKYKKSKFSKKEKFSTTID